MRGSTVQVKCKTCSNHFEARVADRKRGWGVYCSKSCKAIKQYRTHKKKPSKRHDGLSPMKYKKCDTCGAPAINGVYSITGRIEWGCALHHDNSHPFSSDSLGQW